MQQKVKVIKLPLVSEIIMGQSPPSHSYNQNKEGLPFYQGKADFGEIHPVERVYCSAPKKTAKKGDILISVRAPVGDVNIADKDCCIGRGLSAIRVDQNKISTDYLYHLLLYKKNEIANMGTGSTFKAISKKGLESIDVQLFGSGVQKKIVNVLNGSRELINKRKQQITALSSLKHSLFGLLLANTKDYSKVSLKELINSTKNGLSRRGNDSGEIVLKLKDIKRGSIDFSDLNRIELSDSERTKLSVQKGDLLLVRVNGNPEYVGRSAVFRGYDEDVFFNDHIIRVRTDESVNNHYLAFFLNSLIGANEIRKNVKTSAGQYTISRKGLDNIQIILPTLEEQNEFVNKILDIDKRKALFIEGLNYLENLDDTLTHKAFTDQLFTNNEELTKQE